MEEELDGDYCTLTFKSEPHPGCMWGILHILNFHQWHTVKKMLPHRRHSGGRHAEDTENMGTEIDIPDTGEAQEPLHSEAANILSEEKMSGASPTKKKSGKARMRKLIADAMSKQGDHKHRSLARTSRLLRTYSLHHLEPSYQHLPDEVRIDGDSPRIGLNQNDANTSSSSTSNSVPMNLPFHKHCEVCHTISTLKSLGPGQLEELKRLVTESDKAVQDTLDKEKEPLLKRKALSDVELHRDVGLYQSKEFLDALEIFSVKKALFVKILEDPDYALAHNFQGLWASSAKRGLARSGTFPVANVTEEKNMKYIKLKGKKKVNGQLQGNLETDNIPSTLSTNECSEDNYEKSTQLVADNFADSVLKPDQGSLEVGETDRNGDPSPGSTQEMKKWGHRFKDIRHKIRHAIKESRKERHRISMDSIFHRIPYGRKFSRNAKKEMNKQWKESSMDVDSKDSLKSTSECESSASTPCQGRLCRMRRTASLNESLDRYAQLFESTYNTEAKQQSSDRPKLTNEEGRSPLNRAPKSLGRILSLPDLECFRSLQCEVAPDAFCLGNPTWFLVNSNRDTESLTCNEQDSLGHPISKEDRMKLDVSVESRNQESSIEVDESSPFETDQIGLVHNINGDEIAEVGESGRSEELDATMVECSSISQNEQETVANNSSNKPMQASPISVFDFFFLEGVVSSPGRFLISEGQELKPRCMHFDELGPLCHCQYQPDFESASVIGSTPVPSKDFDSGHVSVVKVNKKDEAEFNYVKDLLKLSGLLGNKYLETWHSPDQPLDPSLFEEMECLSPYRLDCTEDETSVSYYNHQLLFDTINEVLLEIYERSFTYWPRPLSCNSFTRPMPVRHHVLEEVWANISWYLGSQPEDDPSLDYFVTQDLSKVDGWMNLQLESECVGLELEELLFNDILDEVIYT